MTKSTPTKTTVVSVPSEPKTGTSSSSEKNRPNSLWLSRISSSCIWPYCGILLSLLASFSISLDTLGAKVLIDYGFFAQNSAFYRYSGIPIFCTILLVYFEHNRSNSSDSVFQPIWPLTSWEKRKAFIAFLVQGLFGPLQIILRHYAIEYVSMGDVAVITSSSPILVTFLAHFLFKDERLGIVPVLSCLAAFCDHFKAADFNRRRQFLAIYLPFLIYSIAVALMSFALIDPYIPILLSSYAVKWKLSPVFYGALTLLDLCSIFGFVSLVYFAVLIMLFSIIKIGEEIQSGINELRQNGDLEAAVRSLHTMHVMILLFNRTFSLIVYLTKLIAINAGILGGSGFVKLIHKSPIFASVYLLFFIESFILYSILFGRIHKITFKIEEMKMEILKRAERKEFGKNYYKKVCRSVPRLGIKVGEFYLLERENIMLFGDFVLKQIVSLLIAF